MQAAFGSKRVSNIPHAKHLERRMPLNFDSVDDIRGAVAGIVSKVTDGWAIMFTIAEGVRAWRDGFEDAGARYKRAMVWIKPDAMPQFNGQGPSIGHEMM